VSIDRRFARFTTNTVMRSPALWRLLRRPLRAQFDRLAPDWDDLRVTERYLAPLGAALDAVASPPAWVLDVGTGNGAAARVAAARWPEAQVVGVDLSPGMIAQARARGGAAERYEVADASSLPFDDDSFDLVVQVNMIPFFDELARVVAPGGSLAIAFSLGDRTPIWVPLDRVTRELTSRGFSEPTIVSAGDGVALIAKR
jgi:SAM-dependent methyltransferase